MFSKHTHARRHLLAMAIASLTTTSASSLVIAQEGTVEEVIVTGIRASLEQAMDIKRESSGVVDAISAEDIGKFPDTNLAESLQRITGVSIDRRNGEGAEVTIRGFGAGFNMVTLNGRQLPSGGAFGGSSGAGGTFAGNGRAFDFSNLASESVNGVEVYKTGRATNPSGGIGGTINIKTQKPLDNPGLKGSVGIKAVHDTTVIHNDDVTPELSGMISWTDDSETFGVSTFLSYQERHSGTAGGAFNDWGIGVWGDGNRYSMAPGAQIDNAPDDGQLYARPNDIRYSFSNRIRERTNALVTAQFRPVDTLTLTADYTYSENYLQEDRHEQTYWFANGNSVSHLEFDDGAVASPLIYTEVLQNKDHGFEQQYREQNNIMESIGFNVDWEVNDQLNLKFDIHHSTLESLPDGPGETGEIAVSLGAPVHFGQTVDFRPDIPNASFIFDDTQNGRGNGNGVYDAGDFGYQWVRIWYASQETEISEAKFAGSFELSETSKFDFGIDFRSAQSTEKQSNRELKTGDWGIARTGIIDEGLLLPIDFPALYDDFDMSGTDPRGFYSPDIVSLAIDAIDDYRGYHEGEDPARYVLRRRDDFTTHNIIEEDTTAAYFQFQQEGELGDFTTNLLLGIRYETTDLTSTAISLRPLYVRWEDNNDWRTVFSDQTENLSVDFSYDNLLPNVDFSVNLTDALVSRISYSKTIARPGYGALTNSVGGFGTSGSSYLGTQATASSQNPKLLPLISDNVDLGLEWYYDDASYASVALFEKRVRNFTGTEAVDEAHYGMRDVGNGPRAQAAIAALETRGIAVDDTSLFAMMAILDNPQAFPGGADDFVFDEETGMWDNNFAVGVATAYDLLPNANDPLMSFRTSKPVNNREAKLYGAEFAVQHFFGDSGFGVQANYTIVRGDVSYDVLADPGQSQFALLGLSDSANLVGIYEKHGLQARLAWNWRDKYLSQTNRGGSRNPTYVEAYSQIDLNVSYDLTDNLSVFVEALNLTGEDIRHHSRTERQPWYMEDMGARYQIGGRYSF